MVEQIQSIMGMFGSVSKGASGAMGKLNPASLMDTMVAWFMQFKDIGFTIGFIGNICLIYMMYIVLKEIAKQIAFASKMKKLQGKQVKERSDNPLYNIKLINDLRTAIYKRKKSKGKEADTDNLVLVFLGAALATLAFFLFFKQYLMALVVPVFLLHYIIQVFQVMEVDAIEMIHLQLPASIDVLLKAATRYGDLRNMLFEAAKTLPQPIRGEFENMARQMNSREVLEVLEEFRNRFDDIWISSFVFILTSMSDDTERSTAFENLNNFRTMLDNENKLKNAAVTEKKISVNTNYSLSAFAGVAGIGACFTETARVFYFSTPIGLLCFVGGFALILATVKMNVKMSSTKGN